MVKTIVLRNEHAGPYVVKKDVDEVQELESYIYLYIGQRIRLEKRDVKQN